VLSFPSSFIFYFYFIFIFLASQFLFPAFLPTGPPVGHNNAAAVDRFKRWHLMALGLTSAPLHALGNDLQERGLHLGRHLNKPQETAQTGVHHHVDH
jgi:hypothetical protein